MRNHGRGVSFQLARPSEGERTTTASATETLTTLHSRIDGKTAQVGVVGLGYVGLPIALASARKEFRTTGFAIDSVKVQKLQRDPGNERGNRLEECRACYPLRSVPQGLRRLIFRPFLKARGGAHNPVVGG